MASERERIADATVSGGLKVPFDRAAMGGNDYLPTLIPLLRDRAASVPQRVFLVDVNGTSMTYGEAHTAALRWASVWRSLGIGPGTTVSTMNPNSVAATVLWLGLAAVGAWEAPIHPAYRGYMFEHAVQTVEAEILVIDFDYLDRIAESARQLGALRRVIVMNTAGRQLPELGFPLVAADELLASSRNDETWVGEDAGPWDIAAIVYTSGTTGPSKAVMVPWGQVGAFAVHSWPYDDLDEDDVIYCFTPSSHLVAKLLPYLAALLGGRVLLRPDFKTGEMLDDIRKHAVTTSALVGAIPAFLQTIPERDDDADLPLRNVLMAPLAPDLERFKKRFGVRVCTSYSSTELSCPITSDGWSVDQAAAAGKCTQGWPWFELRLVDEHDVEVGLGEVGELIVRTKVPWTLNAGYYGQPAATAEAWRNGWFHTGDGFTLDADGFYYFTDRLKDSIRRRGENISSFEVESIVNQHPAVAESAAVAVPSEYAEDEVKIVVVPAPGASIDFDDLIAFLERRMPNYMVPRYAEVVTELPKTVGTLRTQKSKLRAAGISASTWDRTAAQQYRKGSREGLT